MVLGVLFGVGVLAVGALVVVGGLFLVDKVDDAVQVQDCPFLSEDRARDIFGPDAQAQELSGLLGISLGVALDTRGLPDDTSCVVTDASGAAVSRIAEASGGQPVFDRERENAEPASEDRGGGITVTREGWFADDVDGVGDQAFCTSADLTGAVGILVRQGDRVVYVSVLPTPDSLPSGLEVGDDGVVRHPAACERAREIAEAILG